MRNKAAEASGISCVLKNIEAVIALCDMLKTSYGADGMYKLVVDAQKKTTISRSVSSILSGCDIDHPAVRMLVEPIAHLAHMGDCTGFFIGSIGEILGRSAALIQQGVLPTEIAAGLQDTLADAIQACAAEAQRVPFSLTDTSALAKVLSGIVKNTKISELLGEAISSISESQRAFPIDSVRVTKIGVGSLNDSENLRGMLLESAPLGCVQQGTGLRTAIYTCPLAVANMDTKGTVLLKTAQDLLEYRAGDEQVVKRQADALTQNGVGLIICAGAVDPLMLDYLNEKHVAVMKVHSKFDLRRLRVLFGGGLSSTVRPLPLEHLGVCDELSTCVLGERKYTKLRGRGCIHTLVLRGSLVARLEEHERVVSKATCALQVCAREAAKARKDTASGNTATDNGLSGTVGILPGAGLCEKAVAKRLSDASKTHADIRQVSMEMVADALQAVGERAAAAAGGAEVFDIAAIKERALEYALSLSADILSISQMFITKSTDKLSAPKRPGHWDDEE